MKKLCPRRGMVTMAYFSYRVEITPSLLGLEEPQRRHASDLQVNGSTLCKVIDISTKFCGLHNNQGRRKTSEPDSRSEHGPCEFLLPNGPLTECILLPFGGRPETLAPCFNGPISNQTRWLEDSAPLLQRDRIPNRPKFLDLMSSGILDQDPGSWGRFPPLGPMMFLVGRMRVAL